jgi:hypothetical protein
VTELFEHGKIDNKITDGDAYTRSAVFRFENPEGQILNRKMRMGRNFDERTERHA